MVERFFSKPTSQMSNRRKSINLQNHSFFRAFEDYTLPILRRFATIIDVVFFGRH